MSKGSLCSPVCSFTHLAGEAWWCSNKVVPKSCVDNDSQTNLIERSSKYFFSFWSPLKVMMFTSFILETQSWEPALKDEGEHTSTILEIRELKITGKMKLKQKCGVHPSKHFFCFVSLLRLVLFSRLDLLSAHSVPGEGPLLTREELPGQTWRI